MPITHLLTEQGENVLKTLAVSPDTIPWNLYPRPQLKRDSFYCLNGYWIFCVGEPAPEREEGILVPFPPESRLSGICRDMGREANVYYRRCFTLSDRFMRDRVLLHFGAVDQRARVFLNGKPAGENLGGYNAFSLDITDLLMEENILEVYVTDTDTDKTMPYGKQRHKRGGMWYTPVTGIWQTVWLESVPETYIRNLTVTSTLDTVTIQAEGADRAVLEIETPEGIRQEILENGQAVVSFDSPHLWTPEDPYLYHYTIRTETDTVQSYFALRTIEIRSFEGVPGICLNGKPVFLHGLLDQGYYSDGIYTPAAPESYTEDILAMKALGFNTLRKHIKVEPEHFYSECDRLGMLVIQDMVNNGTYSFLRDTALPTIGLQRLDDRHLHNRKSVRKAFAESAETTIRRLQNHPCICCWTIFNEGWGQFNGA
ncbi:MAG: glycoside hydrolase family 2, partial [Clostridia bacterium]|nr:glycoside hydrolase family 2 [Clostridia bacterium]